MTSSVLDREELAWAAGFYDGEGTIWHRQPVRGQGNVPRSPRGGRGQLRLAIQQTDPEVLHRFRAAVRVGKVVGPYQRTYKDGRRSSPWWNYEAHKWREAQAVIAQLWLFLGSVKKAQILRAFRAFHNTELGA